MSFLAVTGFQAALLALVTAGAIVALYFLKLRHRRVFIASSLPLNTSRQLRKFKSFADVGILIGNPGAIVFDKISEPNFAIGAVGEAVSVL